MIGRGDVWFTRTERAGKSTTIRMLTTLTKPSQGRIEVSGFDVVRQPLLEAVYWVVLQQTSVDGDLSVWKYGATWTVASYSQSAAAATD